MSNEEHGVTVTERDTPPPTCPLPTGSDLDRLDLR